MSVSPLHLAVLLGDIHCASALLTCGAILDEGARAEGLNDSLFCEMFGGPPVVGLEDWIAALLTNEAAVQDLIDRKTDLSRALNWPEAGVAPLLERHRLASPELVARLVKTLDEVPTVLHGVCPVHLACLFQQPWALRMLADAGAPIADSSPCSESLQNMVGTPGLDSMPLDLIFLSARVGSLKMLELLSQEPSFGLDVRRELPLVPDLTPPFFPKRTPVEADSAGAGTTDPVWAWCHLGPLELALLHRRVDVAVLLVRLGADLLHRIDHVAIQPPNHYSITDACFRSLTPLHLCALLDQRAAATALLNDTCEDKGEVVPNEHARPQRQALLSATCVQAWATVETDGDPAKEPWLWRDLTPLHMAIIWKSYDVAELLVDVSTSKTLALPCIYKDMSGDSERSFSTLLLAFERDLTSLHRKIAKKFPSS